MADELKFTDDDFSGAQVVYDNAGEKPKSIDAALSGEGSEEYGDTVDYDEDAKAEEGETAETPEEGEETPEETGEEETAVEPAETTEVSGDRATVSIKFTFPKVLLPWLVNVSTNTKTSNETE